MRTNDRGTSLIELIFAMGLGLAVLAIGYRSYLGVLKVSDYEDRREQITVGVQNLMERIKKDVRAGSSVAVSGNILTIDGAGLRIVYVSSPDGSGVRRETPSSRSIYKDIKAQFAAAPGRRGVQVRLNSDSRVHRRPIHVEISSFVSPRNN